MPPSFWESLGERVGYGLAAVVLGPVVARERRARRAMRSALLEFCRPLQPLRLLAPPGVLRRSVQLPVATGSSALEIVMDLESRRVRITASIERLPSYVEARIAKSLSSLHDERLRLSEARAGSGAFRVWTESLDVDVAKALVESVAGGPLERLAAVEVELSAERLDVLAVAPQSDEGWQAIGDGLTGLAAWLAAKWPASYRGEHPRERP